MNKRWTQDQIQDQSGKTAIVTGANSGLGFETACALAAANAHVVMACRNPDKAESALARLLERHPGASAEIRLLDLGDLASVCAFAQGVCADFRRLHLLVNNAGIMMPPFQKTADGFESQFGTNHLGHFALTAQLFALLAGTPGARVVQVSSVAHYLGGLDLDDLNFDRRRYGKSKAYAQSKLANLLFAYELHRRCEAAGVDVCAVAAHPGYTKTNLQDGTMYAPFNALFAQTPAQGALPSLYGAVGDATSGSYYGPSGWFELRGYPREVSSTRTSRDRAKAARLWELSEELTQVAFPIEPTMTSKLAGAPGVQLRV